MIVRMRGMRGMRSKRRITRVRGSGKSREMILTTVMMTAMIFKLCTVSADF